MYAILTYSTDMTSPNYKIEFTKSKKKVREALNYKMKTTYDDPAEARNWHNDIKTVYEMPVGWRKPTKKFIRDQVNKQYGSIYSPNENGIMANAIRKDGIKIDSL